MSDALRPATGPALPPVPGPPLDGLEPEESGVVASDASLDRYARLLQRFLDVPVALVTVVGEEDQAHPGAAGLPEPWASSRRSPLTHSMCQLVVTDDAPLVVNDVAKDARAAERIDPTLRVAAYAGWPLVDSAGRTLGALCAIDHEVRRWSADDLAALADLADACSAELRLREANRTARQAADRARELSRRSRVLLALSQGLASTRSIDDIARAVERVAVEQLGCLHGGIWLRREARSAVERDTLRHVAVPAAGWSSARRNADLAVTHENPLGEAVLTGRALVYDRVADQNAVFPDLDYSAQVGETRCFIPLGLGRPFGAIALVWRDEHPLVAEDRITITALASYVAQAVRRAELQDQRERATRTLTTAMLPSLPRTRDLELTARYRPAAAHDRVGGDWYDAVVTASGQTNLMIGDVAGHDISAAAVMSEVRAMLRAFSWNTEDDPAANVSRLDEAMENFAVGRFASLLYARVEPPDGSGRRTMSWTNAGHFPPLVVGPSGSAGAVRLLDGEPDLLLGVDPGTDRHTVTTSIADGSTMLLFTDGLVERRGESIDVGLARLLDSARRHADLSPGRLLDAVLTDLVADAQEDDIALLAVRFG